MGEDFIRACLYGNLETVTILIENGADVNYRDNPGFTGLIYACRNGHIDIAKTLIENEADINHEDFNGNTAFIIACNNGHSKIIKILIENGANINHENKFGNTGLFLACKNGHIDIVKLLIKKGTNINHKNNNNETAFEKCYNKYNRNIEILNLLISAGYDYTLDKYINNKDIKEFNEYKKSREYYINKKYLYSHIASDIFASIVLLSDDYFSLL